ncbi:helix-turn-helix domain-containing protein [Streptomyces vilmorinianum]|uniref:helix-turn-helix domain-containing protein n=1 Tax=Streptomyces vilmorinianum TaxID=3051092 RepID=UPI0010FB90A4|nr:helix-turn-helix domain-containing protein [Streptomyces vilmorinianum]
MLEQPSFGRRLRQMRTERGLSQAALAGDGMSTGYLSRLESGARQPTERVVAYLAGRLGITATDFEEPKAGSLAQALTVAASSASDAAVFALVGALASGEDQDRALRWQGLWLLARAERQNGDSPAELAHLEELVELGEALGLPELRARAHTQLARCLRSMGDITRAAGIAADAYRIASEAELSVHDTASALLALVAVETEAGRLADAQSHADELRALTQEETGTLPIEALWTASTVRLRQGDHTAARALLEEALERMDSHDSLLLWMRLRLAAASLHLQQNPPDTARAAYRLAEIEPVLALIGTPLHSQEMTLLQAQIAFHEGHDAEARRLHDSLTDPSTESACRMTFRDRVTLAVLHNRLLAREGHLDEAIAGLQQLGHDTHAGSNIDIAAEIWRVLAELLATTRPTTPPKDA